MYFFNAFCRALERFCAARASGFILVLAMAGMENSRQIARVEAPSFFMVINIC